LLTACTQCPKYQQSQHDHHFSDHRRRPANLHRHYRTQPKTLRTPAQKIQRQPRQQRGREKVEQILAAAAIVFEEVGYNAATTQRIADRAGAAIGSLYQFFPDKAAIFKAMELRHLERLRAMWAEAEGIDFAAYPLRSMIKLLVRSVMELFEDRVSRVVFVQFFESREIFQSIDDSLGYSHK
jgi:AcrR family transcriptional regulator